MIWVLVMQRRNIQTEFEGFEVSTTFLEFLQEMK